MEFWLEAFANTAFRRSADAAHDLKTPLNVAVLNLELLRMRLAKLVPAEDDKVAGYVAAIETELRRMARIFDTLFLLSTPPKNEGEPQLVDVAPLCGDAGGPAWVRGHESRLKEAFKLFLDGAARVLERGPTKTTSRDGRHFAVTIQGVPRGKNFELTKLF